MCDSSESTKSKTCLSMYWLPQYLNEDYPFGSEYILDWKNFLLKENLKEIRKSVNLYERFTFYTPKIVESVFSVCKMFRQPPEVRYLAIDVLDRFLVDHFFSVCHTFEEMKEKNMDTWETIIDRMLGQSPLRILTCIQLAMKYSWSNNIITGTEIQTMLKFLGHTENYSKKSILKSEVRVYKHLKYNIPNKTPLIYIEMFLDVLKNYELFHLNISFQEFFSMCIDVLDVAIIYHKDLYNGLPEIEKTGYEKSLVPLKANFVVLAGSVIFASSVLEDPNLDESRILQTLSSIGECKKSEIQALGYQLLNTIQNG